MRMSDHLQPDHLLDQADALAGTGATPGRPKQIDLRRAVSAAYYACYHDVTLRSASQVLAYKTGGMLSPSSGVIHLVRRFSHAALVQACRLTQALDGPTIDATWSRGRRAAWEVLHDQRAGQLPSHLTTAASRLRDLQDLRHTADYDHVIRISRVQAINAVADARAVCRTLSRHGGSGPYEGFFALVALCTTRLPPGVS
jgi:uncharacterized protein (UPF0332 family)